MSVNETAGTGENTTRKTGETNTQKQQTTPETKQPTGGIAKNNIKDAAKIGKAAVEGAATGGLVGAGTAAVKQAALTFATNMTTREGRRRMIISWLISISWPAITTLLVVAAATAVIAALMTPLGGLQQASVKQAVNSKIMPPQQLLTLQRVQEEQGIPWQILAGILLRNQNIGGATVTPIGGGITGNPDECPPAGMMRENQLTPAGKALARCVKKGFPQIPVMYGIGNRGGVGGGDHENGRAIDFMTSNVGKYDTPEARALGVGVLNWVLANRDVFDVKYAIYYDAIWIVQQNGTIIEKPYQHPGGDQGSPTKKHRDHVHVSVYGPMPAGRKQMTAAGIGASPWKVHGRRLLAPTTQTPGLDPGGDANTAAGVGLISAGEGRGPWGYTEKSKKLVPDKTAKNFLAASRAAAILLKTAVGSGSSQGFWQLTCATGSDPEARAWIMLDDASNKECVRNKHDVFVKALQSMPLEGLEKNQEKAEKIYQRVIELMLGRKLEANCETYPPSLSQDTTVPAAGGGLTVGFIVQARGGSGERFAMDKTQVDTATRIVNAARKAGATRDEQIMAIMTAIVEARLRNPPGGDRDSVGAFQQRPSTGWCGPTRDPKICMDLDYSTRAFLGLVGPRVGQGYRINPAALRAKTLGQKCQKVQGSAFPYRYAYWEDAARLVVDAIAGGVSGCVDDTGLGDMGAVPGTKVSKTGWTYPLVKFRPVTSGWGPRNISFGSRFHLGVDIGAFQGEPIVAAKAGTVAAKGMVRMIGNFVCVDHGNGVWTLYQHMSRFQDGIKPGVKVKAGTVIGYVGGTSGLPRQYAPHLHFGVSLKGPMSPSMIPPYVRASLPNPEPFMKSHGVDLRSGKVTTS